MIQLDVKAASLFFFFATLDEQRAIEGSIQCLKYSQSRLSKNEDMNPQVALVAATKYVWDRNAGRFLRGRPNYLPDSGWLMPENLEMGAWKEFQKSAQEDEFLCLIWSKILKISDEDISAGLGVSTGTLRYRVGRALRKLGAVVNPVTVKGSRT